MMNENLWQHSFSSGKLPTNTLDASEQFSGSERTSGNNGKTLADNTIELKNVKIATDEHTCAMNPLSMLTWQRHSTTFRRFE
ncbi:hypothetical protein FM036_37910 [Nostoc sp. HG1]|nr:hypothetical protein [Nostoc sp. HG1]